MVELVIKEVEGGYRVRIYKGGTTPKKLRGLYTSIREADKALCAYLENTDKRGLSRYPGCPERKQTAYTKAHLN